MSRAVEQAAVNGVVVRLAAPGDVDVLPAIEAAAGERFRAVPAVAFVADHDPSFAPEVVAAALDEGRLWVAGVGPHVVGYALALDLEGQPHLEQVSVLPEWSGHGVGRALIDQVVAWASGRGTSLTLATFRDVEWNAPLYAHLGFVVLDEAEVEADPRLMAVQAEEAEHGLDPADRVFMRRPV
jgi:GNAT superfamily N-acetyltransferase